MSPAALRRCLALLALQFLALTAPAQTVVQDIFGRLLNQHGITLVDWDGLMPNRQLRFFCLRQTTGADSQKQTNTVPLHVMDLDLQRTNEFVVTANFDRDITGVFTNATRRLLVTEAANDWTYFFTGMRLDTVHAGAEQTYIWSNNF